MKILFVQKLIYDYRVSFYDKMAAIPGYEVSVLHSGKAMGRRPNGFEEIIVTEKAFCGLLWQKGLRKHCQKHDVVIALFDMHYASTILLALLPRRFKLIFWGIGFGRTWAANVLRLKLAKRAEAIALYMPRNMDNFLKRGIPKDKVFCAPNTIHVENGFFNADWKQKDRFLFLGGLKRRKRAHDLLEAFANALPSFKRRIHIDIVGDGEAMAQLKEQTASLGIGDFVEFHGSITDNEKLRPFFDRAIAIVSPGQAGLTILHGFAFGVPMLTSRNAINGGELDNIKDGENGILYDGSREELSELLVKLGNNPEYASSLGLNAYNYYSRSMTMDHMVNSFRRIIDACTFENKIRLKQFGHRKRQAENR